MKDDLSPDGWREVQGEASPRVRAAAKAICNRMRDIDMIVCEDRWVTVDATYCAENWQKVLEYLAKGAIDATNQEEKDGKAKQD